MRYAILLCLLLTGCQNDQKHVDLNDNENYMEVIWGSDDRVIIQDNTIMSEKTKKSWKPHKVQYWDIALNSKKNQCMINIERSALFGEKTNVSYTYEGNIFNVSIIIPDTGSYCFYIENASSEYLDIQNLSILKE